MISQISETVENEGVSKSRRKLDILCTEFKFRLNSNKTYFTIFKGFKAGLKFAAQNSMNK